MTLQGIQILLMLIIPLFIFILQLFIPLSKTHPNPWS